ncbi:MAG TPA: D-alanyl-D-alanine carboxypeptidase/D-alanyl-D-alanine-endopeptidase [Tepidisphaeraceae bacterium]
MADRCFTRLLPWFAAALLCPAWGASGGIEQDISAVLRDPYFKNVKAGVKIVRLSENPATESTVLFEHQPALALIPASNLKLITTAAALEKFGPDFRYRTSLLQKGASLAIIGDGDPTLGDAELLKPLGWHSTTLFKKWAAALSERGLKSADELLVDDSIFDNTFVHPNWPTDQLHKRYVAGVGGLNFNANCLDFYLETRGVGEKVAFTIEPQTEYAPVQNECVQGSRSAVWLSRMPGAREIILRGQIDRSNQEAISVTIDDPGLFAGHALRDAFGRGNIAIAKAPERQKVTPADGWQTLAVHETPIEQVLARANKDSMNLYAEALCKRLGQAETGEPGSWPSGTAAIGNYLKSIGIPAEQFTLDDGCGLSRKNTISADAVVQVLQREFAAPHRELYLRTLAVAGVDGTLKDRFSSSRLRERVLAKSGFIDGVSSLSGYVKAADGQWYAFSILFNGIAKGTNSTAKRMQEKIVEAIQ